MSDIKRNNGFTIVELLIVIVVIAILAAISIFAYNGIQQRARETAIKTDFPNATKKIHIYQVDNGKYPNTTNLGDQVGARF
jgi:prepilin-type N-terminal cleavage/methylation domain-containing protein